jgi:beta-lactam-binding protein with PASTA domain
MGSPDIPTVEMPKVRGLSQAEAESRLRAVGLKPYILYGKPLTGVPKGHVMSQWPDAGDSLPQGSEAFIQIVYVP